MAETEKKPIWATLSSTNVDTYKESKNKANPNSPKYLSWMSAWKLANDAFPDDVSYKIREWDGKPYLVDEPLGIMVQTSVTIAGITRDQHHFVMDSNNKAQRIVPYTYTTKSGEKTCEAATMFDVNTAIMRCLAKNLAQFGLGYELYLKEDLVKYIATVEEQEEQERLAKEEAERVEKRKEELSPNIPSVIEKIKAAKSKDELSILMNGELKEYKNLFKEVYDAAADKFHDLLKEANS